MSFMESLLSAEFIRAFAWTLFHSLWQGGLLAIIAAGILVFLRKHRPGIRYAIFYIVLMLLPVFFIATFLITYNPGNINAHAIAETTNFLWQPDRDITPVMPSLSQDETTKAWYSHPVDIFENQAQWLVLLWFAGFCVFLLRFSGSLLYVYHLKNHQVHIVDERWNANLHRLSERLGIHKTVRLVESALAKIPMTIGYLKPVILLPLGTLSGVPAQQIDAILLHELAHILRKDYLLNIIQSVIELLFFYHPVTWWLSGLIRQEREHICDDIAVAVNQDYLNYIKALTTMEEFNSKSPLLASAITGSKKKLLLRVKRLLLPVKLRKGFSEGIITFILLIGLIFTLSLNALSVIPNAYDLTGRESGERIYSLLPLQPDVTSLTSAASGKTFTDIARPATPEIPDTVIVKSKSGKVTIKLYTDSTDKVQQEHLNQVAESMDAKTEYFLKARQEHQFELQRHKECKNRMDKPCKVVVIGDSDSIIVVGDSIAGVYNIFKPDCPGHYFKFDAPLPGCPFPPNQAKSRYYLSKPDLFDLEIYSEPFFSIMNDSTDSVIIIRNGKIFNIDDLNDIEELELSAEELGDQMKQMQIEIEREYRDAERDNRDIERDYRDVEKKYHDQVKAFQEKQFQEQELQSPLFDNLPPVPPEPLMKEYTPESQGVSAEKIIRQELIDDGLAAPHKKYVVDFDAHGMYINGGKQSKEVFRKYKHLLESLEETCLEDDETYRFIF